MANKTTKSSSKKAKTTKRAAKPATKPVSVVKSAAVTKAEKADAQPIKAPNKTDMNAKLKSLNLWLGLALVVLAVAAVAAAGDATTVPVTTQYLAKDALATEASASGDVFAAATRHLVDLPVSWMVAKFLLLGAAAYLLAATLWRAKYEAWLERGVNKLRWAGLGVAGGSAVTTAAALGGVSDVATLALIFGSVVLAAVSAAALELLGGTRRLRRLLGAGAIAALALPLVGFALNVFSALKYGSGLPVDMYFTYSLVALWAVAISFAAYFRMSGKGKWADTFYAEKAFAILTFAFLAVLAAQLIAETL